MPGNSDGLTPHLTVEDEIYETQYSSPSALSSLANCQLSSSSLSTQHFLPLPTANCQLPTLFIFPQHSALSTFFPCPLPTANCQLFFLRSALSTQHFLPLPTANCQLFFLRSALSTFFLSIVMCHHNDL